MKRRETSIYDLDYIQTLKVQIFVNRMHDVLNIVEKNRITQIDCKSRDESNEPNYDVIRH